MIAYEHRDPVLITDPGSRLLARLGKLELGAGLGCSLAGSGGPSDLLSPIIFDRAGKSLCDRDSNLIYRRR